MKATGITRDDQEILYFDKIETVDEAVEVFHAAMEGITSSEPVLDNPMLFQQKIMVSLISMEK